MAILTNLIVEARRRHVFRVTGLYAAAAFVVPQLVDVVGDPLGLTDTGINLLLVAIASGFPIAMAATWVFDLTSRGLVVTEDKPAASGSQRGRLIDLVIIPVALGVGYIFALQQEIAGRIAETLSVQFDLLKADAPSRSVRAYELFLRATVWGDGVDLEQSKSLLEEATALDPSYADAWAQLSRVRMHMDFLSVESKESRRESRLAAEKAIALGPDAWLTNLAMAEVRPLSYESPMNDESVDPQGH